MYVNHVFIPVNLWQKTLTVFHDGHPGICAMKSSARALIWYPGMDQDITDVVKSCNRCADVHARPSQNSTSEWPKTCKKWSRIDADHFFLEGKIFLVVIDVLRGEYWQWKKFNWCFHSVTHRRAIVQNWIISIICSCIIFGLPNINWPDLVNAPLGRPVTKSY